MFGTPGPDKRPVQHTAHRPSLALRWVGSLKDGALSISISLRVRVRAQGCLVGPGQAQHGVLQDQLGRSRVCAPERPLSLEQALNHFLISRMEPSSRQLGSASPGARVRPGSLGSQLEGTKRSPTRTNGHEKARKQKLGSVAAQGQQAGLNCPLVLPLRKTITGAGCMEAELTVHLEAPKGQSPYSVSLAGCPVPIPPGYYESMLGSASSSKWKVGECMAA